MKRHIDVVAALEYYRAKDLSSGSVVTPTEMERTRASRGESDVEAKAIEDEALNREREEQVEKWMNDIKMFIRKIDVSTL